MKNYTSFNRKVFLFYSYSFLFIFGLLCLLPIINILAISFSKSSAAAAGMVTFWPIGFNLKSYEFILNKPEFIRSFLISIERIILGVPIGMIVMTLIAYPLSKDDKTISFRKAYTWFFMIATLFSGGLIPSYIVIKMLGLIDNIWVLVLPVSVNVFYVIILLNFFRAIPKGMEEAAFIDGAGHWMTLWKVYIPVSIPSLTTILLFTAVFHWNSWFDGIIFMNKTENYPLQSYLHGVVIAALSFDQASIEQASYFAEISDKTNKAAQVFVGMLPILCLYPILQRYFMTGIVLGSVKG